MSFVVTALVVAGAGAVGSIYQGTQSAKAQREARRAQSRGQQFQAKRERVKQVREALVRQSRIENQAATQGVGGSSGAMSGAGSVASQAASNISAIGSELAIGRTVSRGYGRAAKLQGQAQMFQQGASLVNAGLSMLPQGGGGGSKPQIQGGVENKGKFNEIDWNQF